MPVIWHTGFNGIEDFFAGDNLALTTSNQWSAPSQAIGYVNPINRMFGTGSTELKGHKAPAISLIGRKYSPSDTYGGSVVGGVQTSTHDSTRKALVTALSSRNGGDYYAGFAFSLAHCMGFTDGYVNSWRLGFRLGYSKNTLAYVYHVVVGSLVANPQQGQNRYNYLSLDGYALRAKEVYIEVEWVMATRTINVYVDDVLRRTVVAENSTEVYNMSRYVTVQCEHYNFSATGASKVLEFRDAYAQSVESAADIRLGSSTSVVPVVPLSDDVVQFDRPSGYQANADVARMPVSGNLVPPTELTASLPGQNDFYNVDASAASANLSSVEAVIVRTVARNPGLGSRTYSAQLKSGGTAVESDPVTLLADNTGVSGSLHLTADPADNARWTLTKLANIKIGAKYIG